VTAVAERPGSDQPDGRVEEREFSADSSCVAQAREFVVLAVDDSAMAEGLRLVVSELATNAVLHARSDFRVRVATGATVVRVEVFDNSELPAARKEYGPSAVTGRGLGIVEHIAARWGVTALPDGKVVWFEMERQEFWT